MTFVVKLRGSVGAGEVRHDYLCEAHGRFEASVPRLDMPDAVPCPECGATSPWSPSTAPAVHTQFVVSASQGKSDAKPHRDAMDTRPLAEGRKKEWRIARKKVGETRRHRRVQELLR